MMRLRGAAAMPVAALAAIGCATLDGQPRAADAFVSCVRAAVAEAALTADTGDKRVHCLAAARIAERCSTLEAAAASYGKEMRDILGRGNAQLADIRAGHAGIRCAKARTGTDDARCCESQGY